jgi:hypothetical protein
VYAVDRVVGARDLIGAEHTPDDQVAVAFEGGRCSAVIGTDGAALLAAVDSCIIVTLSLMSCRENEQSLFKSVSGMPALQAAVSGERAVAHPRRTAGFTIREAAPERGRPG